AVRVPQVRAVIAWTAVLAALTAAVALVIAGPSTNALERHLRHGPVSSRQDAWRAAWDATKDRPWLGYGPGTRLPVDESTTVVLGSPPPPPTEAHDAMLQQALGAGVAAAAGIAVALVAMLLRGAG